jgi:hypothetical protein
MGACLGAAACNEADDGTVDETQGEAVGAQSAALFNNGGFTEGGACKVTAGPYAGSSGKYDADGWCCFGNVCAECTTSDGGSRCSDAAANTGGSFPGTIVTNPGPIVVSPMPVVTPGPIVWTPIGGNVFFP